MIPALFCTAYLIAAMIADASPVPSAPRALMDIICASGLVSLISCAILVPCPLLSEVSSPIMDTDEDTLPFTPVSIRAMTFLPPLVLSEFSSSVKGLSLSVMTDATASPLPSPVATDTTESVSTSSAFP